MLEYILFIIGIALLLKGADWLVDGSSSLAKKWGIPTLAIGLTVVAFGTSMPEMVVNIIAALGGKGDIAFGNIVGSNIVNLLFILGAVAVLTPLKVQNSTVWKEIPFSLLAALVLFVFINVRPLDGIPFGSILRFQGIILMFFFCIYLYYVYELMKGKNLVDQKLDVKKHSSSMITLLILGGLLALFIGGKWTVDGAVALARLFGMSEYIISLTIVAIGTSLPELVTSLVAAYRKDVDLAVGNIVGSNIFNIFWILGLTAVIKPIVFPVSAFTDLVVLLISTILLFSFMFIGRRYVFERWQGGIFMVMYVMYALSLILR